MEESTLRWPTDKERVEKEEVCSAHFEPSCVKIDISARASEKKSHKKLHFTYLPRSPPPVNRFFIKLGTNVPLVDVINCDKFCDNLFKV